MILPQYITNARPADDIDTNSVRLPKPHNIITACTRVVP